MSDRETAAELLQRWLDGMITNHEFDDQWPWKSKERVVIDIGREMWTLYDDFPRIRLSSSLLSAEDLGLLNRCLLFLKSDKDYVIPRYKSIVSGGEALPDEPWEKVQIEVDEARKPYWPFASARDMGIPS